MRIEQPEGRRGSLKWIQRAVARRPDLIQPLALPPVRWLSPLPEDGWAEYRDATFLRRLGFDRLAPSLAAWWPARGPQWDALGLADDQPVLVEAKAHLAEFRSPPTQAGPASRERIEAALSQAKAALGVREGFDWTGLYYQFANRLAHLWWLRAQGVQAHLLFVDFLCDNDIGGPGEVADWDLAFAKAAVALGLPASHPLSPFIHHVHPNVRELTD